MKKVATVDAYIERAARWGDELDVLRDVLRQCGLDETIKWGAPCYVDGKRNVVGIGAFKSYVRSQGPRGDVTETVVEEVGRCAGRLRVDDLAERVNLSRRHLGRIMRERVGITPKLFARIARFDRAVQLGRFRPATPWARVALDAGYADQAHLSREFRKLGGIRPSDLRGAAAAAIW